MSLRGQRDSATGLDDALAKARAYEQAAGLAKGAISDREAYALYVTGKRWWYWAPWKLVNPVWPWFWRGGDEHGRSTVVIQPPLLGAFIFAVGRPCLDCALGNDHPVCGEESCPECGGRTYNGRCFNLANDGTHAADGDGWPE